MQTAKNELVIVALDHVDFYPRSADETRILCEVIVQIDNVLNTVLLDIDFNRAPAFHMRSVPLQVFERVRLAVWNLFLQKGVLN